MFQYNFQSRNGKRVVLESDLGVLHEKTSHHRFSISDFESAFTVGIRVALHKTSRIISGIQRSETIIAGLPT